MILGVLIPVLGLCSLVAFTIGRKYMVAVTTRRLFLIRASGLAKARRVDAFDLDEVTCLRWREGRFTRVLKLGLPDGSEARLKMGRGIWRAGEPQAIYDAIRAASVPVFPPPGS